MSLLGWGSVAGAPEEVRAFMQRRVASVLAIASTLWVLGTGLAIFFALLTDERIGSHPGLVRFGIHLFTPIALVVLWMATRSGQRSLSWLAVVDVAGTILQGMAFGVMVAFAVPVAHLRPDLAIVLGATYILVTRAAMIPSTVTTTVVIGVLTAVPVVAGTFLLFRQAQVAGTAQEILSRTTPATLASATSLFCMLSLLTTAAISAVIHRLSSAALRAQQLGQYTLEAKIGEGGMGIVYRARHALLRRPTAVKLLPAARAGAETVARFEREVQLTSQLTHPNTVAIYDYGRTPDNDFYYAMELLDGIDLEDLVARDGPQPPGRVRHILRQIAGSLAEAHARGIVHRDVKPSNVMLCERGLIADVVKVLDFGLARELEKGRADLTQAGQLAGTPLYMSPEQVRAEPLDGRSDLYALGAVGYHLLTGQSVFTAKSAVEVLAKHLHEPVVPPSKVLGSEVPASLELLVLECLAKEPSARPESAGALLAALDAGGDIPPWTDDDARRWWRERAPDVKAMGSGGGAVSPLARTVAVDLGAR